MKYSILIILNVTIMISTIFASPKLPVSYELINLYRNGGINAVETSIEQHLQTKEYWSSILKTKDVSLGYYESMKYLIHCEKNIKNINVYDLNNNKMILSSSVFVGKLDGDKYKEGDLKTPIGVYKLRKKLTKIDPFYGPLALTTNYPNAYDKTQGKTGHGIWIHGLPFNQKRDDYTKGCIALKNTNLQNLDKIINFKSTILQISSNNIIKTEKNDFVLLLSNLYQWKSAWKTSNLDKYLEFYNKDFKKNKYTFEQYKKYKQRVFKKKEKKIIRFSNINIIPYPNDANKKLFKIVLDEYYKTKSVKFIGNKTLYVEIENNKFSILTES